jgi:multisubunit Na+/H+ antiporter MnhE subunit
VPDVIVGAVVGLVVGWCFGPLSPVASRWLSKTSIIHGFLQITVVALAISSQLFPYSTGAPKRVVLQHTFVTGLLLVGSFNCSKSKNNVSQIVLCNQINIKN